VPAAVNRAPCPGDDGGVDAVAASPVMEAVGRLLTGQTRTVGAISTGRMFDPSGFLHAVHAHLEPASGTGQTGGDGRGHRTGETEPGVASLTEAAPWARENSTIGPVPGA